MKIFKEYKYQKHQFGNAELRVFKLILVYFPLHRTILRIHLLPRALMQPTVVTFPPFSLWVSVWTLILPLTAENFWLPGLYVSLTPVSSTHYIEWGIYSFCKISSVGHSWDFMLSSELSLGSFSANQPFHTILPFYSFCLLCSLHIWWASLRNWCRVSPKRTYWRTILW
jgi:hypothetical protein